MLNVGNLPNLKSLKGPILVTGHTGFKGTWLVELLNRIGLEVAGLSLPPKNESLRHRIGSGREYTDFYVDINDSNQVLQIFESVKPVFVFHLAAQAIVSEAFNNPSETYLTNVVGTLNVIEAAKHSKFCKGVQVITTDKVYANDNSGKSFSEHDPLFASDPYSGSKVAAEAVVAGLQNLYQARYDLLIQSVRAGNVIGGGDYAINRLLPDLVRSFVNNQPFTVRNPDSTRPWQHVLEPLFGYLLAAEKLLDNGDCSPYNFGPVEKSLKVSEVIDISRKIWPSLKIASELEDSLGIYEAKSLQISPQRAIENLGWQPIFSQKTAVELTIKWWESVLNGQSTPLEAMQSDIDLALKIFRND